MSLAAVAAAPAPGGDARSDGDGVRSIHYVVDRLFDGPLVRDAWRQRAEVGYIRARHFEPPVTIEFTVRAPGSITYLGPLDLAAWSRTRFASDWASLGGLLPRGTPVIQLEQRPGRTG